MSLDLHHVHVFATDIDASIRWWCWHMNARVILDDELAGARNVFLVVGSIRLHLYDQAPRDGKRGAVHHLGIKVAGLRDVWRRLQREGIASPHGLRESDGWRRNFRIGSKTEESHLSDRVRSWCRSGHFGVRSEASDPGIDGEWSATGPAQSPHFAALVNDIFFAFVCSRFTSKPGGRVSIPQMQNALNILC